MARFDTIKTAIDANINTNGKQDITGGKMNSILKQIVDATEEQITEFKSVTEQLNMAVAGIVLTDNGGSLVYQNLSLNKGCVYKANLIESTANVSVYGRPKNGDYVRFGELSSNKRTLEIIPTENIDEVAIYSAAFCKVEFNIIQEGGLFAEITEIQSDLNAEKNFSFENLLESSGYEIESPNSNLNYYELPVKLKIDGKYRCRLIEGSGSVLLYSKETKDGQYKDQGQFIRVGGTLVLKTDTEIGVIGIFAKDSQNGAKIVLESAGGSVKSLTLSNKETIDNYIPIQNGQKAVFLSVQENGFIVAENGNFLAADTYSSTDYIQTTGIGKIKFPIYFSDAAGLAFYDKNKNYISGFKRTTEAQGVEKEIDVPSNADYVRVCYLNSMPNGDKFYIYLVANKEMLNANGVNDKMYKLTPSNLTEEYIDYSNGEAKSASSYRATGFIKVPTGKIKFPVYFSDAAGLAFYNDKKEYIGGFGKTNESMGDVREIDIPYSCQYIRICSIARYADKLFLEYNGNIFDIISEKDEDVNPCEYTETSGCRTFNNILCIGDSLTEGTFEYTDEQGKYVYYNDDRYSYPTFLKAISGRNITNLGSGGLTTKSWWEMHQNDDFSGHDACIIALGRNDYVPGRDTTTEERYAYMGNIINALREANPKIKVFVATMLNYYLGDGADAVNNDMRGIAEQYNCFLVDISRYGTIEQRDYSYSHLTATGYEKVANYYFNYISYIMANQPKEFMDVQFAGTDHSFN